MKPFPPIVITGPPPTVQDYLGIYASEMVKDETVETVAARLRELPREVFHDLMFLVHHPKGLKLVRAAFLAVSAEEINRVLSRSHKKRARKRR